MAPAFAQACPPNTCCPGNTAPGTPACGAAAGNPLNVMSGNKFQREVDMPALPGVLGLELVRYYNSEAALSGQRGLLGRGWRLSYEAELIVAPGGQSITVVQGDGRQTRYLKRMVQVEAGVTVYEDPQPGGGALRARREPSGLEYTLSRGSYSTQETSGAEDRLVRSSDGTVTTQRQMTGSGMNYPDTEQFIAYDPIRSRSDNITGVVDVNNYINWLRSNGYGLSHLYVN